jgi:hypothetical protein
MNRNFVFYLAGLFDGEGNVSRYVLDITNTNKFLILMASIYLDRLNIKHRVTKRKPRNKNHSKIYRIKICGRGNLIKFYKLIPFMHKQKREDLNRYINEYKNRILTNTEKQLIIKLRNRKISYRKIAKRLKFKNQSTIYYYCHNLIK